MRREPPTSAEAFDRASARAVHGDRPATGGQAPRALEIIRELCRLLDSEEIAYCHWKSTAALERSASGENDLDLLIRRADVQRFKALLYRLGFKQAMPPESKRLPGVEHYYALDRETTRLAHLHAHYQLVLGHDHAKNYRPPIEEPLLLSARQEGIFKVPAPEFELVVFVIRMILKHCTWDAIFGLEGRLSPSERQELAHLGAAADRVRMEELVDRHLPFLDRDLFDRCCRSLAPRAPLGLRLEAGRRLQQSLRAHARRSPAVAVLIKLLRRGRARVSRAISKSAPRKRLESGGALIAVIGGDGAGKSTVVRELHAWLSRTFLTVKVHLGKPRWSLLSLVVKGSFNAARYAEIVLRGAKAGSGMISAPPSGFVRYTWLLRHTLTARDRFRAYSQARRRATNGCIVLCDRYPLAEVSSMDGERARWLGDSERQSRIIRFLARRERDYYRHIARPDQLLVLRLDPEIAVRRRRDEDADWVRSRCREIWELDWTQSGADVVDASRSAEQVLQEIKRIVWSRL